MGLNSSYISEVLSLMSETLWKWKGDMDETFVKLLYVLVNMFQKALREDCESNCVASSIRVIMRITVTTVSNFLSCTIQPV